MDHSRRFVRYATASLAAVVMATPAVAQTPQNSSADADTGNDIIVTAQHREERIQDVGIAISAYGSTQLQRLGVTSSIDIARMTPGVYASGSFGGQSAQYTIRGVTQNDVSDLLEAPVAIYFDDGYIGSLNGQVFGTFDIDRVEILKGPQGTLFGRNATGGLVSFVPKKPTDTLKIDADASYGRFNHVRFNGGIGGPVGEGLSARLSVMFNRFDPIFKNVYPAGITAASPPTTPPQRCCENIWNDNTLGGRAQLQYETDSGWTFRLLGSATRARMSTSPYKTFASAPVLNAAGQLIDTVYLSDTSPILGTTPQPRNRLTVSQALALSDLNHNEAYAGSLHIDGSIGDVQVTSITDWKQLTKYFYSPVDASPVNFVGVGSAATNTQFSQETRFSGQTDSLHWTAGAYFLHINADNQFGFLAPAGSLFAAGAGLPPSGGDLIRDQPVPRKKHEDLVGREGADRVPARYEGEGPSISAGPGFFQSAAVAGLRQHYQASAKRGSAVS